ncbi:hydroxymyristoyl-ACP dehydratase [Clostridium sporogenes]|uniref:hydroxymyristoyl-ACP dehydratase n=1 Tax=Clostridium sporogenes TaxID=1509 RepID=UPI003DA2236C
MNITCSEKCKNNKNGRCILNYISPFLSIHEENANCAYFLPIKSSKNTSTIK